MANIPAPSVPIVRGRDSAPILIEKPWYQLLVDLNGLVSSSLPSSFANHDAGHRHATCYRTSSSVYLRGAGRVNMAGFRFFGGHQRKSNVSHDLPRMYAQESTDLGAGITSITLDNWYAVFLCANGQNSTPVLKIMPYLRARTVAGNVVTFNKGGEAIHSLIAQTYSWSSDALKNTPCLVVSENGKWSGRVATITANTTGQVTLSSAGGIAAYDYILPAPPGYSDYRFLCDYYKETPGDIRNIADDGRWVQSYGIPISSPSFNGAVASFTEVNPQGYISPLATACQVIITTTVAATTSGGSVAHYVGHDGSHEVNRCFFSRVPVTSSAAFTAVSHDMMVQMSQVPRFYYYNGITTFSAATVTNTVRPYGWIVP